MVSNVSKDQQAEPVGLNGITRSSDGNFFEVRNANGYQKLTKEQMAWVHQATNGDEQASAKLKQQGITLADTSEDHAAERRADLVAAGAERFASDKKGYRDFVKQQDEFGGNHKTSGQKFAELAGGLPGLQIAGAITSKVLGKYGGNAHGVVSVTGTDGQLFTITRTDGKSPTSADITLGMKAAKGNAKAREDAEDKGLMVTAAKADAGRLLEAPVTAGSLERGGKRV